MEWDVSPVAFELGSTRVRWYGLLFFLNLAVGMFTLRWQMRRAGRTDGDTVKLFWFTVGGVIIGARLVHVLFYDLDHYLANPGEILMFWKGGIASHGAFLGVLLAYWIYARGSGMRYLDVWDRMAITVAACTPFIRLGNFFNSEVVGRPTDVPWAIQFPRSEYDVNLAAELVPGRHPVQLYEMLWMWAVLVLLLVLVDRKLKEERPIGRVFGLFLVLYFGGRFFLEFFKEFQALDGGLTIGQWLSLPAIALGAWVLHYSRSQPPASAGHPAPEPDAKPSKAKARPKPQGKKKRSKKR